MRKKRVYASLLFRIIGHEFNLVILPRHGVVGPDRDNLRGIVFGIKAPAQDSQVRQVGKTANCDYAQDGPQGCGP